MNIKIAIDKSGTIYIVNTLTSKVIEVSMGGNLDYCFTFVEYEADKIISFDVPREEFIYQILSQFYNDILNRYSDKTIPKLVYDNYSKEGKIPELVDKETLTICDDDADVEGDEKPHLLIVRNNQNGIILEYQKRNLSSNSIRIRYERSAYQEFLSCFIDLIKRLRNAPHIELQNPWEAYQLTLKYKELNRKE